MKFAPKAGDHLRTTDAAPMGNKPIGTITMVDKAAGLMAVMAPCRPDQMTFRLSEVIPRRFSRKHRTWEVDWR